MSPQSPPAAPRDWRILVATMGPLGRMRHAPGTWGSIPGVLLGALLRLAVAPLGQGPWPWVLGYGVLFALCWPAAYAIRHTEELWGAHDPKSIVVDEVLGQAIVTFALPLTVPWLLAGFGLFRLFDISKPWPINRIDRHVEGPWGTLGDDLLAGVVAMVVGLVLVAWF